MLIVCPSCATTYDVGVASLPQSGRQVRCARCRTVWHAEPARAEQLASAATEIAPATAQTATAPAQEHSAAVSDVGNSAFKPLGDSQWLAALAEGPDRRSAAADEIVPAESPDGSVAVQAPPIAPADPVEAPPLIDVTPDHAAEAAENIATHTIRQRRRGAKRKRPSWPLSQLQNAILALLLVDAVIVGWRSDVVRILPQTASFYAMLGLGVNLRGLVFEDVSTTMEQHEGVPVLVVTGNIVNVTRNAADVPRLEFAARNAAREEIYSWTAVPPRTTLPPGETVAFRTRLASPQPEVRDVLVRFVTRRDILAGIR
jgi:predicted Zn finger-like uncharacterized protein